MADSDPPRYKVERVGSAPESIRQLHRRAIERELEAEFLEQLNYINQRLGHDPTVWGDPIRNYNLPGMVDYHGMYKDLNVRFAVLESALQVYLYKVTPVPHRALE